MENLNAYLNSLGCFLLPNELKDVWDICQQPSQINITCHACGLSGDPGERFTLTPPTPDK